MRTKLGPMLQQPDITDELLIEHMYMVGTTETERQKKFGRVDQVRQRKINVQAVKTEACKVEKLANHDIPDQPVKGREQETRCRRERRKPLCGSPDHFARGCMN